jgi:predicted phage terminase large subunit-like protein
VRPEGNDPEEIDFDRAYVKKWGLLGFLRLAWPLLEPAAPFVDGWHLAEVCNHLEAVSVGLFNRLVINVPPGTGKSISTGVCWPAYTWITQPAKKWIFASYDPGLSTRDARRCRELIEHPWYRSRWPGVDLVDRADTMYNTSAKGWRFSTSVRGPVTGRHADIQVVDDPIKPISVQGASAITGVELEFVKQWWGGTMSTRMANPKTAARVIIMQRLHEDDLAGHVLESGEYVHLCLPMRFDPNGCACKRCGGKPCRTNIGGDRRAQPDELLCPERFGDKEVQTLERELGVFSDAQLQQKPSRAGGQIFRDAWFRYWTPDNLPARSEHDPRPCDPRTGEGFDELVCSWDMTFKDTLGSDFVCGQVWARKGADYFLLARVYERLNFPNTLLAFTSQIRAWPRVGAKLIEDKANGPAVVSTLERKIPGLIARPVLGSKVARANGVSYLHKAGNVHYPDPTMSGYEWSREHAKAMSGFPLARHDDTVDAETQALAYLEETRNVLFDALERLKKERGLVA